MDSKHYYWLKLKEDFFASLRIKKLRKLAGGDTFTIIYLKMQLKAIKTNGVLTYTGLEKDFAEELALDIDEDADNVRMTLAYLESCDLIEVRNNEYLMPFVVENIGKESSSAQRMRDLRNRQKKLPANEKASLCDTNVQKCDTEIEKELEIERRDRDRYIYPLGTFKNVILSPDEIEKLKQDFPTDYQDRIERLSRYMKQSGKNYQSHYATIVTWAENDKKKAKNTQTHFENERKYTDEYLDELLHKDEAI